MEAINFHQPLGDQTLVLSGIFSNMTKNEVARILKNAGARVNSAISRQTTALVIGRNPGKTKVGAARARGLAILTFETLLEACAKAKTSEGVWLASLEVATINEDDFAHGGDGGDGGDDGWTTIRRKSTVKKA